MGTFVYANLFINKIAPDIYAGTQMWGIAVAISSLVIGFLSPILGSIADAYGWKRRMMAVFIGLCSLASFALFFPSRETHCWR